MKGADINTTVVVDPEFMLDIKCTEARASKVFTEGLLVFTKVNVIFLYTSCKVSLSDKPVRGSFNINIAANGYHGSVGFKENSQSGRKVIGIC